MNRRVFGIVVVAVWLAAARAGGAQEGHPLAGTWAGDWGPAAGQRTRVTLVMAWDGKAVTGVINPGPDAIPLTRVTPDWEKWTVVIEAGTGSRPLVTAAGQLEEIGSRHRRLTGTWTQGTVKGSFTLTRE